MTQLTSTQAILIEDPIQLAIAVEQLIENGSPTDKLGQHQIPFYLVMKDGQVDSIRCQDKSEAYEIVYFGDIFPPRQKLMYGEEAWFSNDKIKWEKLKFVGKVEMSKGGNLAVTKETEKNFINGHVFDFERYEHIKIKQPEATILKSEKLAEMGNIIDAGEDTQWASMRYYREASRIRDTRQDKK